MFRSFDWDGFSEDMSAFSDSVSPCSGGGGSPAIFKVKILFDATFIEARTKYYDLNLENSQHESIEA